MAGTNGTMMGFLTENPPKLSSGARDFIREYPNRARMAIAVALETAAAQSEADAGQAVQEVPDQLRAFVAGRASEGILGVKEAAARLGVSRTTVYEWSGRNTLIAWRGTKRGLLIPAAQIVGAGRVVPGLADVVKAIGDAELAWAFLSQDWPFQDGVGQPLDRLNAGRLEEVLSAAAGFGATFA